MNRPIGIIIPTFNNPQQLAQCVSSVIHNRTAENLFHVYIVNNGHKGSCDFLKQYKDVTIFDIGDNLGWTGGLEYGMEHTKEPYLVFLNDDTFVPEASRNWLNNMINYFRRESVAAVAPTSNVVMGGQNIWSISTPPMPYSVQRFLIFFCVMVKREYVEKSGGIDSSLSGGDDFDLSMRLWNNGYKTVIDRTTFIYHHGFQTGTRVQGDSKKAGGWNSYEYKNKVDAELIRKHGFRTFVDTMHNKLENNVEVLDDPGDLEGDIIRKFVKEGVVYEFGVGSKKTVEDSIGVDIIPVDNFIDTIGSSSVADITHDLNDPIKLDKKADTIIARHVLEHLIDPVATITNWASQLNDGGRLIVAVPDNDIANMIPLNIEHLHAFNKDSLFNLLEICGLEVLEVGDTKNGISIYGVAEK